MTVSPIHDLKALSAALAEARTQAESGAPLDLAGLEAQAAALCEAALSLPKDRTADLLPLLDDIAAGLDRLAATLTSQHAALAAAAEGRPDPHTARQRAAAVYGRPRPPEIPEPPLPSPENPA